MNWFYRLNPLGLARAPLNMRRLEILLVFEDQRRMMNRSEIGDKLGISHNVLLPDIQYLEGKGYVSYDYPNGRYTGVADTNKVSLTAQGSDALLPFWAR